MDTRGPAGPRFDWSGSGVQGAFNGTGVSVTLGNEDLIGQSNEMEVVIDSTTLSSFTLVDSASHIYTLASGFIQGQHTASLYKST